jgi:hypothetical protein
MDKRSKGGIGTRGRKAGRGDNPGASEKKKRIKHMANETCAHISSIKNVLAAKKHVCDDCIKIGGTWVHLRTCQSCGGTHCCDSSPNRHASKHAKASGHPVVASAEPGERWLYCFPDEAFAEY